MLKIWNKDNTQLLVLLFISFISVYYLPMALNRIIFGIFLLYTFITKKDYLWLVFFFILMDAPGRLFSSNEADTLRIPLYSFSKGFSFGFPELFTLAFVIKTLFKTQKFEFVFKREFLWFFLLFLVFVIYSLFYKMGLMQILATYRNVLPWLWILIFPNYIRDEATLAKVSRLIFPIIFLSLISQLSMYFTGRYWESFYNSNLKVAFEVSGEGDALRSISMPFFLLFGFVQSVYYLTNPNNPFSKNYLIAVAFIATLSILLSATRGWIIAFVVFYVGIFLFTASGLLIRNVLRGIFVSIILFTILQFTFPVIEKQVDQAFERLLTVEMLAKGDVTAGGTLSRLSERGPRVMNKFSESPIFGWGFTTDFYEYSDGHVGNQNLLLNVGMLGFIILNLIFLALIRKIWLFSSKYPKHDRSGTSLKIYALALIAIFIIHSSSTQFWGFIMTGPTQQKQLVYAFILCAANAVILSNREVFLKSRQKTGSRSSLHSSSLLPVSR